MLEVIQAEYVEGYKLKVSFSSGERGVVDLADALWGPVFAPLRNVAQFQRFYLSPVLHTIAWENEADFAPEYLRAKMLEQAQAGASDASPVNEQPHAETQRAQSRNRNGRTLRPFAAAWRAVFRHRWGFRRSWRFDVPEY